MKKTLYFDKESLDILDLMPPKKQSEYAREAVKFKHRHELNEDTKEEPKEEKSYLKNIEVRLT